MGNSNLCVSKAMWYPKTFHVMKSTPICVQVHFVFHYHGESEQPLSKQGWVAMNKWIH